MRSVGIFLIAVALIAGLVGYASPSQNLEIRTWYDLNAIRSHYGVSYLLMNDLNSSTPGYEELASTTANQGKGWEPIGAFISQQADHGILGFEGTFDGQGYEIRDLFINRSDESYVGLFLGVGWEGVIKDIGVVNATVTGNKGVGALAGWNRGTVLNSYFAGSVTGNDSVGALVGLNEGTVNGCDSTSSVTGNIRVGILVGLNDMGGTVLNSYSTGNATGHQIVGGLVGGNIGTVLNSYSTGSVSGNDTVGGLVGLDSGNMLSSYRGTVTNSFWNIQTSGQATSDGGEGKTTAQMKSIATFSGAGWCIIAVTDPSVHNSSYIWNIVDNVTYPFLSRFLCCPQGPSTQMTTRTTPLGYFELTVSPAEVCANVGEQIEIHCTIDVVFNDPIDINSVYVVLFDSYGSIIREQAMTKDYSWHSTSTVYTIVGDEAYYKIKVNFAFLTFPGPKKNGKYSEYGAYSFPIVVKT